MLFSIQVCLQTHIPFPVSDYFLLVLSRFYLKQGEVGLFFVFRYSIKGEVSLFFVFRFSLFVFRFSLFVFRFSFFDIRIRAEYRILTYEILF